MVSNLDLVSMIFALSLFNNSLATSAKCLGGIIINIYRNHDGFCIGSALIKCPYIYEVGYPKVSFLIQM
jgi:hypothetical protein